MIPSAETLILEQAYSVCQGHREALQDDIGNRLMPRNQFTHDYPDSATERFERLQAATQAARQLVDVMTQIATKLQQRFGTVIGSSDADLCR